MRRAAPLRADRGGPRPRRRRPTRLALPLALAALLAPPGLAPARAQPVAPVTHVLRLPTGDGTDTTGVLFLPPSPASPPVSAARPARAGVVLVHGYGGNSHSGVPGHLAPALAQRGFAALAVNLRDHDAGPKTTLFEEGRWDLLAAVDELARRGAEPIAVVAHSLGTNTALHAAAESRDPRLRALALLAAPGNAFEWNARLFGTERATAVLEDAQRLQAAGRGRELMSVDLGPLGRALYSADHLVSLRGPATRSDPYRNLAAITAPVLIVHAGADRLVDPAVAGRLRTAATAAPRVDVLELPGADHGFTRHQAMLADAIDRWLGEVLGR